MTQRKLRIILYIGPWGGLFDGKHPVHAEFTTRKHYEENGLYPITRGEGQAMQFVLEDYDFSTEFAEAFEQGLVQDVLTDIERGHYELRFIPYEEKATTTDN